MGDGPDAVGMELWPQAVGDDGTNASFLQALKISIVP
jgi:hypothetical protein